MNPYRILLLAMLVGCSKPNYVYRFQFHSDHNSDREIHTTLAAPVVLEKQRQFLSSDSLIIGNKNPSLQLLASTSTTPVIYSLEDNLLKTDVVGLKEKTGLKVNPVKKQTESSKNEQEGNPKKNWAATLGLLFAFLGLISLILGVIVAPVFSIPGVILSAIGLKSEKKKRAKAGLVFSLIGIGIVLIWFILLALSGGYGA